MKSDLITKNLKDEIVQKIKVWWDVNRGIGPAVIGISGGKDSTVVAGLLCAAVGHENVLGVMMPDGTQKDISDSRRVCEHLKINNVEVNIGAITLRFNELIHDIAMNHVKEARAGKFPRPRADFTRRTTNIPPRIRMTMLYAIAQSYGGRVINTSNASEAYVGWGTLYGDTVGDFAPIKNLFVDEVIALGKMLKLPDDLVEKRPSDGLTDRTDEENLGFSYADVKKVALKVPSWQEGTAFADIEAKHKATQFKREIINVPGIEFYRDRYGKIIGTK